MVTRILKLKVTNTAEFEAIKRAMDKPDVRAFVTICGHLEPLSDNGKRRVLTFMRDQADEERQLAVD